LKNQTKGIGSYLIFMGIMLALMFALNSFKDQGDPYTQAQYVTDLQSGAVEEIIITPNKEAPTGYATVIFKDDVKKLYATDIVQVENIARENGYDPEVEDIQRESWF